MHRIDGAGHVDHLFVAEDPATLRPPTEITPEIMNAFQEELATFIEWAGILLAKGDNTQLKQALLAKFTQFDATDNVIAGCGLAINHSDQTLLRQAIIKMIQAGQRSVIINNTVFAGAVTGTGKAVYWDSFNSRFDLALADGTAKQNCVGFADVANACVYAFGDAALFAGLTPGSRYYLDGTTAGAINVTAPSNVVFIGIAKTATEVFVDIDAQPAPAIPATIGAITGMLPTAISGTNTTAAVTISSGQASDSTGAKVMAGPGHAWLVSNGNSANGYQGGNTLPNSSTIHFFECWGGSGYCSFASTSLMPTPPAGYNTYYRRIFSLNTTAAGALIPGAVSEIYGGAIQFSHATPLLDISAAPTSANRTLYALTVPTGIKVGAIGRANGLGLGVSNTMLVTSPDEPDLVVGAFSSLTAAMYDEGFDSVSRLYTHGGMRPIITNTSGQVGIRSSAATGIAYWATSGFIDFRRA